MCLEIVRITRNVGPNSVLAMARPNGTSVRMASKATLLKECLAEKDPGFCDSVVDSVASVKIRLMLVLQVTEAEGKRPSRCSHQQLHENWNSFALLCLILTRP